MHRYTCIIKLDALDPKGVIQASIDVEASSFGEAKLIAELFLRREAKISSIWIDEGLDPMTNIKCMDAADV